MQIDNSVPGLMAEYSNEDGKEFIILSGPKFGIKDAYSGLAFLWRSPLRGAPLPETKFLARKPAVFATEVSEDSSQWFKVELPERSYCVGFIRLDARGGSPDAFSLRAPVLFIDNPEDRPHSPKIFLLRSPGAELEYVPERPSLSVSHGSGKVTAFAAQAMDGGLEGQLNISGSGYTKAELFLRRTLNMPDMDERLAQTYMDELMAETKDEQVSFAWKPVVHEFDQISIMPYVASVRDPLASVRDLIRPLGGEVSESLTNVKVNFTCDGPGIVYSLYLKGHRGLFSHDEDVMKVTLNV